MKKSLYIILAIGLVACGGSEEEGTNGAGSEFSTIIDSPLDGDFQNDTVFVIDPTVETTVESPNGSSIDIPANILVDAEGNPITEPVELSFTQYHSAADILASGIPMTYEEDGEEGNFKSAGMFTLRANSGGKDVFIKDGEEVTVNLASDEVSEDYNYYELNEQTGDWTFENNSRSPVRKNPRFDPSRIPVEPKKADKNAFVLDLDFDLSDFSELSIFSGIVWEYVGDHDSLDPRKNELVSKVRWSKFDLEPTYETGYEYWLTMSQNQLSFTTKVRAALQGDDFDQAMENFKQRKIEVAKEMDRIQKPFIRSVQITGFVTANYDYVHRIEAPVFVDADFSFGADDKEKEEAIVFVVHSATKLVVNYGYNNWDKFSLDPNGDCKILAVLPDNKIFKFNKSVTDCYGEEFYTFDMEPFGKAVAEKGDLETAIASL